MVTPAEVLRSFRRRLPSIVFTTLLVTVAVVALLVVWPNQYRSEGLMYVRLGRGALAVDPTTKATQSVSMQESRTAEVVSIGEMIGSREIAERAVDKIGVEQINQPRTWMDQAAKDVEEFLASDHALVSWLPKSEGKTVGELTAEQYEAQLEREQAIKKVSKAINVEIAKNGYTVAVAGKGDDPLLIQSIVQAVMDEYGRYHVQAHSVEGSESFFEKRAQESRDAALTARRTLQETRNEMGWLSAASAEETLRKRIIDLEAKLSTADSELAEAISQAEELRRQLDGTEEWVPIEVTLGIANAAGDQMRSQLYDVQIKDGEELARVSPNHPRYKLLQDKMQQSAQLAESERDEREERREAINPVYQELETQFQTVRAKAVGLQSRRDAINDRLASTQSDLKRLNADSTRLAELTWEAELAEETYRDHARSLEEARVNSELDELQMSDVSVIQDATLNLKKSGPMRGLLSVVGLLLGLSLGLLQAILRDSPVTSTGGSRADFSRSKADRARARTTTSDSPAETSEPDHLLDAPDSFETDDSESSEPVPAGSGTNPLTMNDTSGSYNAPVPR